MDTKIKTEPVWPPNVAKAVTVMMSSSKGRSIIIFWTPKSVEEFKRVTRFRGHSRKEKKLNKTETNRKKNNSGK